MVVRDLRHGRASLLTQKITVRQYGRSRSQAELRSWQPGRHRKRTGACKLSARPHDVLTERAGGQFPIGSEKAVLRTRSVKFPLLAKRLIAHFYARVLLRCSAPVSVVQSSCADTSRPSRMERSISSWPNRAAATVVFDISESFVSRIIRQTVAGQVVERHHRDSG